MRRESERMTGRDFDLHTVNGKSVRQQRRAEDSREKEMRQRKGIYTDRWMKRKERRRDN